MDVDDLTWCLTTNKRRALVVDLAPTLCYSTSYDFSLGHYEVALQHTRSSPLPQLVTLSTNWTKTYALSTKKIRDTEYRQYYSNSALLWNTSVRWNHAFTKRQIPRCLSNPLLLCYPFKQRKPHSRLSTEQSRCVKQRQDSRFNLSMLQGTRNHGASLFYACANYSAQIWALAFCTLSLALSSPTRDLIPAITLTSLENVYATSPLLLLHLYDSKMRKVRKLFLLYKK